MYDFCHAYLFIYATTLCIVSIVTHTQLVEDREIVFLLPIIICYRVQLAVLHYFVIAVPLPSCSRPTSIQPSSTLHLHSSVTGLQLQEQFASTPCGMD